jgi:hypothetical protein
MTTITRLTTTFLALTALSALVGCGGATSTSHSIASHDRSLGSPSRSRPIVARAEEICARKEVETRGVGSANNGPSLTTIAAHRARTARELATLNGPSRLTAGYRRLATLIVEEANLLRRMARYSSTGRDEAALATERKLRQSAVAKQALTVGLASCA